jgi:hypothetical protein
MTALIFLGMLLLLGVVLYLRQVYQDRQTRDEVRKLQTRENRWLVQRAGEKPVAPGKYAEVDRDGLAVAPWRMVEIQDEKQLPATSQAGRYWRRVAPLD